MGCKNWREPIAGLANHRPHRVNCSLVTSPVDQILAQDATGLRMPTSYSRLHQQEIGLTWYQLRWYGPMGRHPVACATRSLLRFCPDEPNRSRLLRSFCRRSTREGSIEQAVRRASEAVRPSFLPTRSSLSMTGAETRPRRSFTSLSARWERRSSSSLSRRTSATAERCAPASIRPEGVSSSTRTRTISSIFASYPSSSL